MKAIGLALVLAACGSGAQGDKGDTGAAGAAGAMGAKGDKGDPGDPGTTGQDLLEAVGTGQLAVTATTNFSLIPGLALNVTVPANAKVHIDTSGGIQCTGTGSTYSAVDIAVFVDGSITNLQRRVVAANTTGVAQMLASWWVGRSILLAPGSHTVDVRAAGADANMATANVSSAAAPQLQSVLTVTVLKN